MSGRGRNRNNRNWNPHRTLASVARETASSLAADSPILATFKRAASQLIERQDRHERLVKLSRDITIESKRIIFLLHSPMTKETTEKIVREAKERLLKLINGPIMIIGLELENSPAYLHSRAVTAGFQEFIEARTLCTCIDTKSIISYEEVQKELTYEVLDEERNKRQLITMLPHTDYLLGLADLTGELMRKAINSISNGDSEDCYRSCQVVRHLYSGYLGLFGVGKELARKMGTTRANVRKVEAAIYALSVRGGEASPATLAVSASRWEETGLSDDEGFY